MCRNTWVLPSRLEARTRLLAKWKHGNWKWGHTEYCAQHSGWHVALGVSDRP